MPVFRCCVEGCKSRKPGVKLFHLPANDRLREIWLQLLTPRSPLLQACTPTKEVLIQKKVCILHFEEKYLIGNKRTRLAWPTLYNEEEILTRKPFTSIEICMHKVLHGFPNPKMEINQLRFNTWMYAIGGEILGLDNSFVYKYRRVCRSHFEDKYLSRNNRISNIAIPILNLPDPLKLTKSPSSVWTPMKKKQNQSVPEPSLSRAFENVQKDLINNDHTYALSSICNIILKSDESDSVADGAKKRIYKETAALKHTNEDEDNTEFIVDDEHLGETEVYQEIRDDAESDSAKHRIYEETAALIHTNEDEDNTEFRVDHEHLGETEVYQEIRDDTELPKDGGRFSWQKSKQDVISLDEKRSAADVTFIDESQLVPDLCNPEENQTQIEFSCNVCKKPIIRFRYACAQCRDWDLCGACEARGEHATHFVLRIPPHKTRSETRAVLAALRQLLAGAALHEDPSVAVIKDEVKTEDPLCDDEAPQELSEVQANKDTEPLDAAGSAASENELYEAEYLGIESEASMSSVEDSITDTPIDKVYATRQKRKLSCADHSDTVPQKVQKQDGQSFQLHYDNSTNELILSGNTKVHEPARNEYYSATRRKRNYIAPQIKISDLELYVDRNAVIAPHTETVSFTATNNLIQKSRDDQNLIASNREKDCFVSSSSSSLSVEQPLELYSLVSGVDTNETQYMTLDGQLVEVIDCTKELRVTVTRLAEGEVRAATGPRGGKR